MSATQAVCQAGWYWYMVRHIALTGDVPDCLCGLQDSLNAELKGKHDFSVHIASPGMVATELLLGGDKDPRATKIINILAEEAEVVAAWMVPRMRGVRRSGKYFK